MQIAAEPSRKTTVAQPSTSPGIIILSGAEGCKLSQQFSMHYEKSPASEGRVCDGRHIQLQPLEVGRSLIMLRRKGKGCDSG
jgi:hypothetical protein